jgi:NAD(P)H-dependent FMN reductase
MSTGPILVISGTNRPDANALKIARLILSHYKSLNIPAELYSLSDLPREIFDSSSYAAKPPAFLPVQQRVLDARGLHLVTPEYNGSMPGVLKYFIDMLKFPESFEGKPVAFVGEAAGMFGALRPVEQLAQIFSYRNAYLYPERVFIPGIGKALDPAGHLLDPALTTRLSHQAAGFNAFITSLVRPAA